MKYLVCGGAGYIGSHMTQMLVERGHEVVVFDNLSTGNADAVLGGRLIVGDILDSQALDALFEGHGPFDMVMHFCARSLIGESLQIPEEYFHNNVDGTLSLLDAMYRSGHGRLVFSSTAAVYGSPELDLIDESQPCAPLNPYGKSKLLVEQMLKDYSSKRGLRSVALRYFNVAGAHPEGILGERHDPETHLIPNVLRSVQADDPRLEVFGTDYQTPDGSCIRDYIHVCDLCEAHLLAGEFLDNHDGAHVFNLGNGSGFSVLEIIQAARTVTGQEINYQTSPRRAGDPSVLVSDASRAQEILGWDPVYTDIEQIIETAWLFHSREEQ